MGIITKDLSFCLSWVWKAQPNHRTFDVDCTANPTWGDIFEFCFKAQSSKLESLCSLKRGKRDVRALSFELSKMSPQVELAVSVCVCVCCCCPLLLLSLYYFNSRAYNVSRP